MTDTPLAETGSPIGQSVSLSANGSVLALGGPGWGGGVTRVYHYNGSAWARWPPLVDKSANDSDGTVLAVGGPAHNDDGGAAWVYRDNGSAWGEMPGTPLYGRPGWRFGESVDLSSDGMMLAVGGPGYCDNDTGAAWVYRCDGSTWDSVPGTPLRGPAWSKSGASVSLASDGSVLAVGAPDYDDEPSFTDKQGATLVYRYDGSEWVEVPDMPLADRAAPNSRQGQIVSLALNGTVLAVGGPQCSNDAGAIWLYRYEGGVWAAVPGTPVIGKDKTRLGEALSLSSDGSALATVRQFTFDGTEGTWVFATASGCGPGTYLASGSLPVACAQAPGGSYAPGYTTSYSACPLGTYSSTTGLSVCPGCPPGTFGPATGGTSCLPCPPGTHSGATAQSSLQTHVRRLPPRVLLPCSQQLEPRGHVRRVARLLQLRPVPPGLLQPHESRPLRGRLPSMQARLLFAGRRRRVLTLPRGDLLGDTGRIRPGVRGLPDVRARRRGERPLHEDRGVVRCVRGSAGARGCAAGSAGLPQAAGGSSARHRAWREQVRRDRLAGEQLEALLAVHGVKDPDALRAVQVGEPPQAQARQRSV
jgi:hypothetical protein